MVVVAPLREMVCELESRQISVSVLEVNHNQLFVSVLRQEKR